jgi:hypothetical protein
MRQGRFQLLSRHFLPERDLPNPACQDKFDISAAHLLIQAHRGKQSLTLRAAEFEAGRKSRPLEEESDPFDFPAVQTKQLSGKFCGSDLSN